MKPINILSLAVFLILPLSIQADGFKLFDFGKSEQTTQSDLSPQAIKLLLQEKLPGIPISQVEMSPKEGIYQVFYGSQVLYVTSDGQFIFTGNMVGLSAAEPVNLTEQAISKRASLMAPQRAEAIASLDENDMVVFKAPDEQYTVNIFTDVDCGYCRKLHKEVPELNKRGITVRYLAYPRAGVGSSAYEKLVSIWCAEDKLEAMDDAKLRRKTVSQTCENPVASHYELSQKLGLTGTPALILDDGELIGGYLPFEKLHNHLKSKPKTEESGAGK